VNSGLGISFDAVSFLFGLAVATIAWWMIGRARPLLGDLQIAIQRTRSQSRDRRMGAVEEAHRRGTLRRAQGMHLAASLFALDDIMQEPQLLAPPAHPQPGGEPFSEDIVASTIPYLPAWPDLAAAYNASTLTWGQALSGGANLVVIGQPGAGKSVALAYLATLAANQNPSLGSLADVVPFLVHVADLELPAQLAQDALEQIAAVASQQAAVVDEGRMTGFVDHCFRSGRALLLIDGCDELTSQGQRDVTECLSQLLHTYPRLRIVTSGAPEYLDGLLSLGFIPLAVASWNSRRRRQFLRQWLQLLSKIMTSEAAADDVHIPVDPLLLESWLSQNNGNLTPLELTLAAWGACVGDCVGASSLDAISAHVRRLSPDDIPMAALETLAMQVILTAQPVFDPRRARNWVREFELPEEASIEGQDSSMADGAAHAPSTEIRPNRDRAARPAPTTRGLLGRLLSTGLLMGGRHNKARFAHPVIGGYLAGRGLGGYKAGDTLLNQPDWIGKSLTTAYFAAHGDVGALVDMMLQWSRLPMERPLLNAARWLRIAPAGVAWHGTLMRALTDLLQAQGLPMSLRGQALAALVHSGDTTIASLFRQMVNTDSNEQQQLAVLGSGMVGDERAAEAIAVLLQSSSPATRRAACLALVAIGTTRALEHVGHALLGGDEELQRAAAEALANDPYEGHAMLRDGIIMSEIPLRRATVYGLGRVREIWANELLERARADDEQWVVRNAATEMLDAQRRGDDPRIPRPLTPPSEAPWLIAFAGTLGLGISPGAPATDILIAALKAGSPEERLEAVSYLKRAPGDGVVRELYGAMYGNDGQVREAAFLALWEIGATGYKLPDPTQYGLS
jgi:HEAT repeat protein